MAITLTTSDIAQAVTQAILDSMNTGYAGIISENGKFYVDNSGIYSKNLKGKEELIAEFINGVKCKSPGHWE